MDPCKLSNILTRLSQEESVAADAVKYHSEGVVLVIGDGPQVLPVARRLASTLNVVFIALGATPQPAATDLKPINLQILDGRIVALQGWLGNFRAEIEISNLVTSAPSPSYKGDRVFDLVVDLAAVPLFQGSVPPLGYFAPHGRREIIRVEEEAKELVGDFAKPRFFKYDSALCAHQAFGNPGCTRCLDVCGTQAISSAGDRIQVEPYLCQGCAACTLACPTGALSFARPTREDLLRDMQVAIEESGQSHPVLVVHSPGAEGMVKGKVGCAKLSVNPLAAFGEELWLAALALGVSRVLLLGTSFMPPETQRLMEERLRVTKAVLRGLGYDEHAVVLATDGEKLAKLVADAKSAKLPDPVGKPIEALQKRALLSQSLAGIEPADGFDTIDLPSEATLGSIQVKEDRCTLCSMCARLCPTSAIRYVERSTAQLYFAEAWCVQCGICARACPEMAITLAARLSPTAIRDTWRALSEDELAQCIECSKPFAPRRLVRSLVRKAVDELQIPEAEVKQMHRCPECRHQKPI